MVPIPEELAASCRESPERMTWLGQLPAVVEELKARWSVDLGQPVRGEELSSAWVAPAQRPDGTLAVLKVIMPHLEADHEIDGLRFWDGDPTVRLLEADDDLGALLLERCEPGTHLRVLPEPEQDLVIAGLLRRLWRVPTEPHPFEPLSAMTAFWAAETLELEQRWVDPGLVREGLHLFEHLPQEVDERRAPLLATDLHAGNVLSAKREPWLVIDPKPFVGDPAFDATQHLLNCRDRLLQDAQGLVSRMSELLGLEETRVGLWLFARCAAESIDHPSKELMEVARRFAP